MLQGIRGHGAQPEYSSISTYRLKFLSTTITVKFFFPAVEVHHPHCCNISEPTATSDPDTGDDSCHCRDYYFRLIHFAQVRSQYRCR